MELFWHLDSDIGRVINRGIRALLSATSYLFKNMLPTG